VGKRAERGFSTYAPLRAFAHASWVHNAWARRTRPSLRKQRELSARAPLPTLHSLLLTLLTALTLTPVTAFAAYPERPVTIVVPFAPGGANDVVVRIIQQPLSEALGQPVIVENRGGAGGNIGFGFVARAHADGYTLLLAPNSFAVNPSLYDKVPYDPFKDFEPVAEISFFPVTFAVRPDLGVSTLKELIAHAKEMPGRLNYSTPGPGTLPHLATELLKLRTGIDMVHIPYAGAAPAAQALLSRTVDVGTMSITVAMPLVQAGHLKALAVTGAERWPDLPDVPTVEEAGVPSSVSETWQGVLVPAGTPREVVTRLATALVEIARRPNVRDKLRHAGFAATGRGPDAFARRIAEDVPKWKEVIEKARISAK
jgi:tripartite-type tricarboxylate transporter receptor subunit TctC